MALNIYAPQRKTERAQNEIQLSEIHGRHKLLRQERESGLRGKVVNDAVARVGAPLPTQYSRLRSKGDKAGRVQLAKSN